MKPKCPYCQRRHRKTDAPCTERAAEVRAKERKKKAAAERIGKVGGHRKVWRVLLDGEGREPTESWWDSYEGARDYARIYEHTDRIKVVEVTRFVVKKNLKGAELVRALLNRAGWCESATTIPRSEWGTGGKRRNGALKVRQCP